MPRERFLKWSASWHHRAHPNKTPNKGCCKNQRVVYPTGGIYGLPWHNSCSTKIVCLFVMAVLLARKNFLTLLCNVYFLHNGPIKKFSLSTSYWDKYPEMDQCLLFLSRKGIKELVLDIDLLNPLLPAPSAIFFCQQLISLTLCGFELKLPRTFQGFPCLKYLNLEFDAVSTEVVENLISGCPLLEKWSFQMLII